ncbi:competence type IV pilus minor pilin ComGD [Mammaliicoccus sp. Dog046]|uniref:competence type IV pilus minor pilin ComGD n=1 Tax=Mammaliicoccus sp. Dog046 TaxID=3034233 RepID=UPI002B2608A1|nr:competence type IV pilus minor pilin ComGD [Mammaliicoccus sp. Dog046]WQK86621.1 competence type IV pilus minor pilin ComGD [Mammaliicoccus sp. Dog046]
MKVHGFTLIEMIFVMSIVSLIMLISMILSKNTIENVNLNKGLQDFEVKLEYLETKSIASKRPILVWFKPNSSQIEYQIKRNDIQTLSLYKGHVSNDNQFTTLVFDGEGNINQFGTLKMVFNKKKYNIVFRIEKGRYRVVEE